MIVRVAKRVILYISDERSEAERFAREALRDGVLREKRDKHALSVCLCWKGYRTQNILKDYPSDTCTIQNGCRVTGIGGGCTIENERATARISGGYGFSVQVLGKIARFR